MTAVAETAAMPVYQLWLFGCVLLCMGFLTQALSLSQHIWCHVWAHDVIQRIMIPVHYYAAAAPLLQQYRRLHNLQPYDKYSATIFGSILDMQDVCDFCHQHLEANQEAFANPRLKLIYDDAKAQLQQAEGQFDVIIADLADPVYGGPCYQVNISKVLPPHRPLVLCTAATTAAAQAFPGTCICVETNAAAVHSQSGPDCA